MTVRFLDDLDDLCFILLHVVLHIGIGEYNFEGIGLYSL